MPILVDPFAAPPVAPPVPVAPPQPVESVRDGIQHTWMGWDGSEWDLSDTESGLFFMPGIRGLAMPTVTHYRSSSPSVHGSQWRGMNIPDRDVFWPLRMDSAGSSQDWLALDAAFWVTMRPEKTGTWTVQQPTGVRRSIDLRFNSDDTVFVNDPSFLGRMVYGVTLDAEQPFWREDPIVRTFRATVPAPFFSGPGIVQINSAHQLAHATVDNPGDVAAYVVWTLAGPFDSASVGTAGKSISVPFALGPGEMLSIYTQPEFMIAIDGSGNDRTDELGAAVMGSPSAVQPSAAAPLTLSMVNPGADAFIEASLTPYFYRAW